MLRARQRSGPCRRRSAGAGYRGGGGADLRSQVEQYFHPVNAGKQGQGAMLHALNKAVVAKLCGVEKVIIR